MNKARLKHNQFYNKKNTFRMVKVTLLYEIEKALIKNLRSFDPFCNNPTNWQGINQETRFFDPTK